MAHDLVQGAIHVKRTLFRLAGRASNIRTVPLLQPYGFDGSRLLVPLMHWLHVRDVVSRLHGHWPVETLHTGLRDPTASQEHRWHLSTNHNNRSANDWPITAQQQLPSYI